MKARIIERAHALGAGAIRFTSGEHDPLVAERLRAALARGDLATWGYDDAYATTAATPEHLLPGARTVICLAVPYATDGVRERPGTGRVSNYAWSRDYHAHMQKLLRALAAEIDALAGANVTRVACDTSPLAERAFAERAGLGWIGKHTNLIVHGLGSFVFLGEIVTSLELVADAPLRTNCGACTRCVVACPTGALRADYTIDARRCISDLTQRTDAIPRELRALIGTWIWGCDICQDVCPPTRNAGIVAGPAFAPLHPDAAVPALLDVLALRSGTFKRRFARTAMGWRGSAILRRNAAVALGNLGDRATVPGLVRALVDDPHPLVRGHSAWALGRIGSPQAFAALRAREALEEDGSVRGEIEAALEPWPPNER